MNRSFIIELYYFHVFTFIKIHIKKLNGTLNGTICLNWYITEKQSFSYPADKQNKKKIPLRIMRTGLLVAFDHVTEIKVFFLSRSSG